MTVPATHRTLTGRPRGEKHEVRTLWADRLTSRTGHWRIRARPAPATGSHKRVRNRWRIRRRQTGDDP
jgi:hypothetical protein